MNEYTRQDLKRDFGWLPNFVYQPSEEERIEKLEKLIERTKRNLAMFEDMLKEKDLW